MSVRVVLVLLDQFTNTRVLILFHNRMWQSKNSEVNVHLVQHWLLVTLHVTCVTANKCPRSIMFCLVFNVEALAVIRWTCVSCTLRVTCVKANNGCPHSIMIWVWIWLIWLRTFKTVEQLVQLVDVQKLLNPFLPSNHLPMRSLEGDDVTHKLSHFRLLQFPS